jgi:broad specificity phosphatase PhoE
MSSNPEETALNLLLTRKMGAAELFLIRHGDAVPDAEPLQPSGAGEDQPLSQLGQKQAAALAEALRSLKFDAIYSSPLRRTRETAAPLAKFLGMEVLIEDDLREVYLGNETPQLQMSAETGAEVTDPAAIVRARQRYITETVARTGYWSVIPGAEPSADFRRRVVMIIDAIANRHLGQRVAVFSHGGVINVYLAELLGIERDFFFPIPNTSVNVVRVAGKQRVLRSINDLCHLRAAKVVEDA